MPIYVYNCAACNSDVEKRQSFNDAPLTTCDACGGDLRRVLQPVGIIFKGSGFYVTDSRGNNGANGKSAAGGEKNGSSGESTTAAKESTGSGESSGASPAKSEKADSSAKSESSTKSESTASSAK